MKIFVCANTHYLNENAISAISFLRWRYSLSANPGWFISRSGSYFVIRWLQLSNSLACLGNQGVLEVMLSSPIKVQCSNTDVWRRDFRIWSKLALDITILMSASSWPPSFLLGRVSRWQTDPLNFSMVFKMRPRELMPSRKRSTNMEVWGQFSVSGCSLRAFWRNTSSSVSPESGERQIKKKWEETNHHCYEDSLITTMVKHEHHVMVLLTFYHNLEASV